jgi:hypothetical protein
VEIDALNDIEPRIPDFKNTINYCIRHMFQDLTEKEREAKITKWLGKSEARKDILKKAVEICLRARDASEKARNITIRNVKSTEEANMINHIEQLIDNA